MFKRLLIYALALLPLAASAQMMSGDWYTYPTYNDVCQAAVESPSKFYYVSAGYLYSYDKDTNETYSYTQRNLLSDNKVADIQYNYDRNYLMVIYENTNIDLLFEDGRVVNMSDIKDAVMNDTKSINDVSFYKGYIYVATSFGLVVFDDKNMCVSQSGIYNKNIKNVTTYEDNLYVVDNDNKLYMLPLSDKVYSFDKFTYKETPSLSIKELFSVGDDSKYFYCINSSDQLCVLAYNRETGKVASNPILNAYKVKYHWVNSNGKLFTVSDDVKKMSVIDNGAIESTVDLPASFANKKVKNTLNPTNMVTTYTDASKLWAVVKDSGVGYYEIDGNNVTPIISPFKPLSASVEKVTMITPSYDGSVIYTNNIGPSHYIYGSSDDRLQSQGYVNIIKNGEVTDITPDPVSHDLSRTIGYINNGYGTKVYAPKYLGPDPTNPNRFYYSSGVEGIYIIEKNSDNKYVEVGKYNNTNAPFEKYWGGYMCHDAQVDKGGNLWTIASNAAYTTPQIYVLPAAKRALPSSQVQASDWIKIDSNLIPSGSFIQSVFTSKDSKILMLKHSDCIVFRTTYYSTDLFIYDTKGTYDDFSDDTCRNYWKEITDQDGKVFQIVLCMAMAEDNDGKVWISGVNRGVITIEPWKAVLPDYTCTHVKVPRNDGTDFADYLFETEDVTDISVDASNRKWFSTKGSGVYLVSPDGSKILEHFNTDNSYLPTNWIYNICADPLSNRVYMGSEFGLTVYNSSSAPASDDYKNVYAFPNPVRPGYSGWITINGLMDNSYVKICDSSMATIHSGRSEGGMFMWDGHDISGNRVKSGVYYVCASLVEGSQGDVVTKILVVN